MSYPWSGYYEAVKELLENDEKITEKIPAVLESLRDEDPVFSHIINLENATSVGEVKTILKKISEQDQNKLNSPLLDSLKKFSINEAIENGEIDFLKFYLSKNIKFRNIKKSFITAVEKAENKSKYFEVVKLLLLVDNSNVNLEPWQQLINYQNGKALRTAAERGYFDTAELLLKHGAQIRDANYDAIEDAIFGQHKDIVDLFIKHGATTDIYYERAYLPKEVYAFLKKYYPERTQGP